MLNLGKRSVSGAGTDSQCSRTGRGRGPELFRKGIRGLRAGLDVVLSP